jgi:hypothetical protein
MGRAIGVWNWWILMVALFSGENVSNLFTRVEATGGWIWLDNGVCAAVF